VGLEGLLSDLQHHREPLLDRGGDAAGHLGGGVPVEGPHGAAALLAAATGRLMTHQLVDDPGRDASVLQPGREGVPKVVGAMQIHDVQQRVTGRGQHPPTLTVLVGGRGQVGSDQLGEGDLDGG
jgi:hypothetical protein